MERFTLEGTRKAQIYLFGLSTFMCGMCFQDNSLFFIKVLMFVLAFVNCFAVIGWIESKIQLEKSTTRLIEMEHNIKVIQMMEKHYEEEIKNLKTAQKV